MEEKYRKIVEIAKRLDRHGGFCRIGDLKQLHKKYESGYDPVEEFCKALDDLHWFIEDDI